MKLDYFDDVANLLDFSHEGYYYLVDIVARRKHNIKDWVKYHLHDINCHLIKYFFIESKEQLLSLKDEIVSLCESNNCCVYIEPVLRKKSLLKNKIIQYLETHNYELISCDEFYNNVLYESSNTDVCLYMGIDIDGDNSNDENITKYLELASEINPNVQVLKIFNTPGGKWCLCTFFDSKKYFKKLEEYKYPYVGAGCYGGIPLYSNLK